MPEAGRERGRGRIERTPAALACYLACVDLTMLMVMRRPGPLSVRVRVLGGSVSQSVSMCAVTLSRTLRANFNKSLCRGLSPPPSLGCSNPAWCLRRKRCAFLLFLFLFFSLCWDCGFKQRLAEATRSSLKNKRRRTCERTRPHARASI